MKYHTSKNVYSLLVSFFEINMEIRVKTVTGKTILQRVDSPDTVADVKAKIGLEDGIPSNEQRLLFAGIPLEDGHNFFEYNISNNSLLHLLPRVRGGMVIFVEKLRGGAFTLEVNPMVTVATVKSKIHNREGVTPVNQRLLFRGIQLEDKYSLRFYGVEKEMTIHLVERLQGKQIISTSASPIFFTIYNYVLTTIFHNK